MSKNIKEVEIVEMDRQKFNTTNLKNYPMIKSMAAYGDKLMDISIEMGMEFIKQCNQRKREEYLAGNISALTNHKTENLFYSGKTDNHYLILA